MMRIFSILLLGALLASAVTEPPLPSWKEEDRKAAINDGWLAGRMLLTFELAQAGEGEAETPLDVEAPTEEELGIVGVDENEVSEGYLIAYFADKPAGHLVDPQDLLSGKEKNDLEAFLGRHSSDSSIDLYLYVFGSGQQIPGDVREEEVVERLYSVGKPAVVIYYHLGEPQRAGVYLSPVITDAVSAAEQRRALESSVIKAFDSTKPFEQLKGFLVQMSIRIYWMERMADGTADQTMGDFPGEETSGELAAKKAPVKKRFEFPAWALLAVWSFATLLGGLLVSGSLIMWWRARARFRFPEFEVEPRFGAGHAAGVGAVISFASPATPPGKQRSQVPDYMRRT